MSDTSPCRFHRTSPICVAAEPLIDLCVTINRNMLLNHLGKPSIYLSACMALWGLISALTGATHNFTGAVLTRFFLGISESAFFPVSCH